MDNILFALLNLYRLYWLSDFDCEIIFIMVNKLLGLRLIKFVDFFILTT